MKILWTASARAIAVMTCLAAGAAQAQTPATKPAEDVGLAEIVVTAQKRAQNIQDVPLSVSAFGAEMLQRAQVKDVSNLQGLVPGLVIAKNGAAPNNPVLGLRGISLQDVEKSVEPGVGIVLDGVPLGFTAGTLLDAFDIERIEVLRGPQGTLFGKNTTGGTINIVRTKAKTEGPISGKIEARYGSFSEREIRGLLYVPIVDGKLGIKLGADYLKNNGTFRNVAFGGRNGDRDTKTFIVSVRATPTERLDMTLSYERMEDDSELVPFVPAYVPYLITSPAQGYFGGKNNQCYNPFLLASCSQTIDKKRNTVENQKQAPAYFNLDGITFDGSYDLGGVKAFVITGYRRTRQFDISDFDATRFALFKDRRVNRTHQFSHEFRLESDFSDNFKIIGGAFYYNGGYTTDQRVSLDLAAVTQNTPPGVGYLNGVASYNVTIDTRSVAMFAQAEYKLDKFKIIVGGRQTWDRKKIDADFYRTGFATNRDVSNLTIGESTKQTARYKKFTPKFVLQYEPTRDFQAYVSYSKGYNSGGFYGRPAGASFVVPFKPESMDAYEIGFKSEWFDRRLRLNVSAYHNNLKNKQEDLLKIRADGAQFSTTLNAAKAQYNGVEIELSASPVKGLTISSATGYLDAKYKNFIGDLGQGVTDLSVLKLRRTPHWTQGLIGSYVFDLGTGQVNLSSSLQYLSRYDTNNLNDPRFAVPATTRIDLGAGYTFPIRPNVDLSLDFAVKNVTNNTTFAGGSSGNTVGTFIEEFIPTIGRAWSVAAKLSF